MKQEDTLYRLGILLAASQQALQEEPDHIVRKAHAQRARMYRKAISEERALTEA